MTDNNQGSIQSQEPQAPASASGRVVTVYDIDFAAFTTAPTAYMILMSPGETSLVLPHWNSGARFAQLPSIPGESLIAGDSAELCLSSTNWFLNINGDGTDLIMVGGGLPAVQQVQVPANPGQGKFRVVTDRHIGGLIWRWSPGG